MQFPHEIRLTNAALRGQQRVSAFPNPLSERVKFMLPVEESGLLRLSLIHVFSIPTFPAHRTLDLDPEADRGSNLASLTYMIRCCFAHGPAAPVWRIARNKYRTRYRVGNKVIDLSDMDDGTPFEYASIGEHETANASTAVPWRQPLTAWRISWAMRTVALSLAAACR